jgi:hypothetical protein
MEETANTTEKTTTGTESKTTRARKGRAGSKAKAKSKAKGKGKSKSKGKAKTEEDGTRAGLTRQELRSAVCYKLCTGFAASKIADTLNDEFPGLELSREEPYAIIQDAAKRGWLKCTPPLDVTFEEQIRELHPWLDTVRVVQTTVVADVARYTARKLLQIARSICHDGNKKTVRIGLAGGHSVRHLAQELASQLCVPVKGLPDQIWFHALATGFDPEDPTTDPNAFVTFFQHLEPVIQVRPRFRGLSAPAMVSPEDLTALRRLDDIANAFAAVTDLDIIVTSGTRWSDEHGALHRRMRAADADAVLDEKKCIGDVLWQPIAASGPIVGETELRALTLVELTDLPTLIKDHNVRVMLMLAPCGACHKPKGELLEVVLNQDPERQIVTDVVVDSVTAGEMLRRGTEADRDQNDE